jgi:hypothetical protein
LNNETRTSLILFQECLEGSFLSPEQIRIINALSSIWKIMLLDKIYNDVNWKDKSIYDILRPENKWTEYRDVTEEEAEYAT